MESVSVSSLLLAVIFWIVYFAVVAFGCHFLYMKLRGEPPRSNVTMTVNGRQVSALTEWEARDKRLQRQPAILPVGERGCAGGGRTAGWRTHGLGSKDEGFIFRRVGGP